METYGKKHHDATNVQTVQTAQDQAGEADSSRQV